MVLDATAAPSARFLSSWHPPSQPKTTNRLNPEGESLDPRVNHHREARHARALHGLLDGGARERIKATPSAVSPANFTGLADVREG
ncbi:MAG: hypothetical protein AABZ12_02740 [Planctomycetota bacterium]